MNNVVKSGIIFVLGAASGAGASWYFCKTKYEKIADEEIACMKEYYTSKLEAKKEEEPEEEDEEEDQTKKVEATSEPKVAAVRYSNIIEKEGYTAYSNSESKPEKIEESDDDPYIISPDEFGENEEYERVTYIYYQGNDFLADEDDNLIEDVDHKVGWESLNHFGDYEDDAVHVRNDRLKTDFEILRSEKDWVDQESETQED